jgi:hypothetical protein
MTADLSAIGRRAAMLREAADALPTGKERDLLLIRVYALEDQLQTPARALEHATAPQFHSDAAK